MKLSAIKKDYARAVYHMRKLQRVFNKMHDDKVLLYEDFKTQSPCASLWEMEKRFEATTKEQIARAFASEVNSEYNQKHR